jgi:LuxR family transcriptional regulator, maltose regulon positive regulatory protein
VAFASRAPAAAPLLATKFFAPRVPPGTVPRRELLDRLDEGLQQRLTLISAPAGYGKTTLLGQWLVASRPGRPPIAWLSLDPPDNDPVRFWTYVAAALDGVAPGVAEETLTLLRGPRMLRMEAMLTPLVNAMAAAESDLALMLDDYHVVESAEIHEGLAFLIDHLPPRVHVVIASRSDPPLPLARWRARTELVELRVEDLRFGAAQTETFLERATGLHFDAEQVQAVQDRTEGWIAGLHLTALSQAGAKDPRAFVAEATREHRYVVEYLAEEILRSQPASVATFLVRTSILERLNAGLCDAVLGVAAGESAPLLAQLTQANLFLSPLDEGRQWYRYHALFAEALRHRLAQDEPQLVPELHRRAAAWLEQQGMMEEAMPHLLTAGDAEGASRLVEGAGFGMLLRGETRSLLSWVERLPEAQVRGRPRLAVLAAWALLGTANEEAIEPYLQWAEVQLEADDRALRAEVTLIRGAVAMSAGDMQAAISLSNRALELLQQAGAGPFNVRAVAMGGVANLNLGAAYRWTGEVEAAIQAFQQARLITQMAGSPYAALTAMFGLADSYVLQGKLRQAIATCDEAIRVASRRDGRPLPFANMVRMVSGAVQREWDDLPRAEQELTEGLAACSQWGLRQFMLIGHMHLAMLRREQGDPAGAREILTEAKESARGHGLFALEATLIDALLAWMAIDDGDLAEAERWLAESRAEAAHRTEYVDEVVAIGIAKVRLAQGRTAEALQTVREWIPRAAHRGRGRHVIILRLIEAQVLDQLGEREGANAALVQAMELAEPEGFVRIFLDEGPRLRPVLERFVRESDATPGATSAALAAALLARFPSGEIAAPAAGPPAAPQLPTTSLLEALTEREVEVLRLVGAGMSNQQIADELVIALGTLKKHLNNIYGKLGVNSRTRAVATARALGMLD